MSEIRLRLKGCGQVLWAAARSARASDIFSLAAIFLILAIVEVTGRNHAVEMFDLAAACILVLVAAIVAKQHRQWNLQWTNWLIDQREPISEAAKKWGHSWGLDLRRVPAAPRAWPPLLRLGVGLPALLSLMLIALNLVTAAPLRTYAISICYVLYVVVITLVWSALVVVGLMAMVIPLALLFDVLMLTTDWTLKKIRWFSWSVVAGYGALVFACGYFLPTYVGLGVLMLGALIGSVVPRLPAAEAADCLWQRPASRRVFAISLSSITTANFLMVAFLPMLLLIIALGGEAVGREDLVGSSPDGAVFARCAMWIISFGVWANISLLSGLIFCSRWHDPSRPVPLSLYVANECDAATQSELREAALHNAWKIRFAPAKIQKSDVVVSVVRAIIAAPQRVETIHESAPNKRMLEFTPDQLQHANVIAKLVRQDHVQRRRQLVNGLETAFRRVGKKKKWKKGSGYWVAPHLWFVEGLSRDTAIHDDNELILFDIVGPLYRRIIAASARQHFHEVMRALNVDLMFVEDGVGFRGLRRVLRVMFERFDIDGGRSPLREIHFAGLPKIHVILHEFELNQEWQHKNYPEPDYDDLARVRILHIFRDRGGEEELADAPEDPTRLLVPSGLH